MGVVDVKNVGGTVKKYKTIVIDPPWQYGVWGKNSGRTHKCNTFKAEFGNMPLPYDYMKVDEIKELPLKNYADENCELYLWTTQKYLPVAFEVLKEWGWKYCQTLTWCKKPRGTGQGGVYCPTTEFLILGRLGKMPKVRRIDSTWFLTKRPNNAHSKKPEFFQDLIETVSEPPRLEIFARRKREGWDVFGNEVESDIDLLGGKHF
uniref:Putative methyltransferase n=1 Tax=viral metagenome TaxID=1070528 RepID=A0A6M3LPN2_9ZZZZ